MRFSDAILVTYLVIVAGLLTGAGCKPAQCGVPDHHDCWKIGDATPAADDRHSKDGADKRDDRRDRKEDRRDRRHDRKDDGDDQRRRDRQFYGTIGGIF